MTASTLQTPQHAKYPEVQVALAEIRTFAGQMQEMTALFARAQADMTRQISATTIRLDKAVEAVAMGEARIAAQIASFDRMANDARRSSEAHERDMREVVGSIQKTVSDIASESFGPLRSHVSTVLHELATARESIGAVTSGLSGALETAVCAVDANAASVIARQSETLAARLDEAMVGGEASLAKAREALDHSAGALAHRIWTTAEAQDSKMQAFESLTTRFELLCAAVPDPDALSLRDARDQETSQRMEENSKALNLAVSKIVGAAIDMQGHKRMTGSEDGGLATRIDVLAGQQAEIVTALGGLTRLLDTLVIRTVEDRNEAVTEMLDRMDQLRDSIGLIQTGFGQDATAASADPQQNGPQHNDQAVRDLQHQLSAMAGVRLPNLSTLPRRGAA